MDMDISTFRSRHALRVLVALADYVPLPGLDSSVRNGYETRTLATFLLTDKRRHFTDVRELADVSAVVSAVCVVYPV